MITRKLKICFGCKLPKLIYKNKDGEKYCKTCYFSIFGFAKIKPVADKQAKRLKKYMVLRNEYLTKHPICEICQIAPAIEIHHKKGRIGDNLFQHFCAICRDCHNKEHFST